MENYSSAMIFLAIFAIVCIFLAGFFALLAQKKQVEPKYTDRYPYRPMDNRERRALWSLRYQLESEILPNNVSWKWLTDHEKE